MTEKRGPESVGEIAAFALGVAYACSLSTLKVADNFYSRGAGNPVATSLSAVVGVAAAAAVLIPRLRKIPQVVLALCAFVPIAIASTVAHRYGLQADTSRSIRAIGLLVAFAAEFGAALWFLRQKRELDRQVYTQSAVIAFFLTVAAGVVYGTATEAFGAPHLAFTVLSLFGLTVFVISLSVLEKRYS